MPDQPGVSRDVTPRSVQRRGELGDSVRDARAAGEEFELPVRWLSGTDVVLPVRVGGDDGMVGVPAAGHRDVEVFAVEAGPDQHDPEVTGGALRGGDGGGPAVVAVPGQV